MLIYSFICSILFTIVLLSFTIMTIVILLNQKKLKSESEKEIDNLINGFATYDLLGGTSDKEKEKKE